MNEYKRLGDYIREVNVRNRDLKVTNLLGVNLSKQFFPSIANIIGTDLSKYKIIEKGQFGCKFMSVGRDGVLPISLKKDDVPAIISSAYCVFEVENKNILLPEYLMMWLCRPEFDRQLSFYAGGDVRGGVNYEDFCEMPIIIPSIERQREIVAEYETLTRRIRLNEQIIQNLETTAQTLYRKMFVDGIDKENLPEGWRMGRFTDLVNISGGGTPNTDEESYWNGDIPFFTPLDSGNGYYCVKTTKMLTFEGFNNCSSKLYKKDTIFVTARGTVGKIAIASMDMAMNQSCYALLSKIEDTHFYVHQFAIETIFSLQEEALGAVFNALVTKDFETKKVIIPTEKQMKEYNILVESIYEQILLKQQENKNLTELQSLLLVRLGE